MPDLLHVRVLRDGPRAWKAWRSANPGVVPLLDDLKVSISERQFGPAQGGPIDLSLAELRRAGLDQATLTDANLTGAILVEADLSDARLERADLQAANLAGANLAYASLADARLDGTNLCGANLRLARGLTQAQIDTALGDRHTILPAGLTQPTAWLQHDPVGAGQLVVRASDWADVDESADPYRVLGVNRGATPEEARAAWLKLVKELHPAVSAGVRAASERLKLINHAYQSVKVLEREAQRRAGRAAAGNRSWAIFAVFFLLSAAFGLAAAVWWMSFTIAEPPRDAAAPGEAVTEMEKSSKSEASQSPPPASAGPVSTEEPVAGADKRLR